MKEVLEIRVNKDFAHLLFSPNEGRMGNIVQLITLTRDDPRYAELSRVYAEVKKKYKSSFFFGWDIRRSYSKKELAAARLFHVRPRLTFEPAGEDCGTIYDESTACRTCGAGATQLGPLRLRRRSIPQTDIARTIAGEIIASKALADAVEKHRLKGISFEPIEFSSARGGSGEFYQLRSSAPTLSLAKDTISGVKPFDLSTKCEDETFKCPAGDTIGLNLLSEVFVTNISSIESWDFYATNQNIGVRRGVLRPRPEYLCSQRFREMVEGEKLKGFRFEIAHILP